MNVIGDEILDIVRDVMKHSTGTNCTFVDDDVKALGILARKAIDFGLAEDAAIPATMKAAIKAHIGA